MPLTLYNQFEGHWCHWTCKWCKCLAISIHSYSFWETSVTMWVPMWIEHKWTWQSWLSLAGCQRRSHVSLGGPLQYGPFSGSTCKSCKHQEKSEYQPFAPLTETCKCPKLVQNLSKTCPKLSETINRIYHENETPTRCFFSEIKDEALKLGANAVPKLKTGTMEWGQPQSLYKKGRHVKAVSKIRLIRTYQSLKQHEHLLRLFFWVTNFWKHEKGNDNSDIPRPICAARQRALKILDPKSLWQKCQSLSILYIYNYIFVWNSKPPAELRWWVWDCPPPTSRQGTQNLDNRTKHVWEPFRIRRDSENDLSTGYLWFGPPIWSDMLCKQRWTANGSQKRIALYIIAKGSFHSH
jgi:hypothetical protein